MNKNSAFLKQIDFTGKIAVVTGGSRGIGESIARALASLGAEVVLVSRKIEGLKEVEDKIKADGGKAISMPCNTGKMDEIEKLFTQIKSKYDKIDILVNNSATNPFFGTNIEAPESAWDKTHDVNLKGYFFVTQQAARIMRDKGVSGSIINIGSVNGLSPAPMQGVYSITKAGVISMTKSWARELAPFKIRVNAVLPGMTDTKFSSVMTTNEEILNKMILPKIPMGRIAQPDEMAGAVVYLASDASSYTTGIYLIVDGGMTA
jgi:NAD(P)-dependent dehydrogenase (short-subunit alcohol dehydrogenase family)